MGIRVEIMALVWRLYGVRVMKHQELHTMGISDHLT